jgi:hypothetical protein
MWVYTPRVSLMSEYLASVCAIFGVTPAFTIAVIKLVTKRMVVRIQPVRFIRLKRTWFRGFRVS